MDRILIILKKENGPRASSSPALGLNMFIGICGRSQVGIYRTIQFYKLHQMQMAVKYDCAHIYCACSGLKG